MLPIRATATCSTSRRPLADRMPSVAYLAGNSLGLQPRATAGELAAELAAWQRLGVEGHFEADRPWFSYHQLLTEPAARLVGALPVEVVAMNSLTVNLHLLMVSFYRPLGSRSRIVVEDTTFPSDSYAVRSQAAFHGLDPDEAVVRIGTDEVIDFLDRHGDTVALVLLGGVNYLTGELLDIPAITAAGHAAGAVVGWDLAHAAGNVPLALHDWDVDFAAWCSYKYLNAGPGSVAGAFVHQRHLGDASLPRFEGWWSNDRGDPIRDGRGGPAARERRRLAGVQPTDPGDESGAHVARAVRQGRHAGAARAQRAGSPATWRECSTSSVQPIEIVTPRDPQRRGAQLSLRVAGGRAGRIADRLRHEHGVIVDTRQPDIAPPRAGAAVLDVPRLLAGRRRAGSGSRRRSMSRNQRRGRHRRWLGSPAACSRASSLGAAQRVTMYERRPDPRRGDSRARAVDQPGDLRAGSRRLAPDRTWPMP